MLPSAGIALVQRSLQRGLDHPAHVAIGRALKPLHEDGALIPVSGQTYHNMRDFLRGGAIDPEAEAFDAWLRAAQPP